MFGIGGRAFTRAVERDLGVDFDQAEALKVACRSAGCLPKAPRHRKGARKTADVWISGIELALAEFDKLDHLPHRLFLCGGGSSLDMLMSRLEEASWYKSLPFTSQTQRAPH